MPILSMSATRGSHCSEQWPQIASVEVLTGPERPRRIGVAQVGHTVLRRQSVIFSRTAGFWQEVARLGRHLSLHRDMCRCGSSLGGEGDRSPKSLLAMRAEGLTDPKLTVLTLTSGRLGGCQFKSTLRQTLRNCSRVLGLWAERAELLVTQRGH